MIFYHQHIYQLHSPGTYIAVHLYTQVHMFTYLATHPYALLNHLSSSSRTREQDASDQEHDANVSIITDNADTITACVK